MYLEGRREWPLVELDFATFERHWQGRLGAEGTAGGGATRVGADLFLCCACAAGNAVALRVFEHENRPIARSAIAKVRRDDSFVEDCLQDLWEKLLWGPKAKIKKYAGRGALKAWVRVTATRAALDRCRQVGLDVARHTELSDDLAAAAHGAELVLLRARYAGAFQNALRDAVAALPPRERNALRMHVGGGCSIDQIGLAYGVHRATAARWLERARESIAEGVRHALSLRKLQLTTSEFQSLGHALASELELRLSGSFVERLGSRS
jgi:RNA polymerase sigma-70 factor (ECF subfamily)